MYEIERKEKEMVGSTEKTPPDSRRDDVTGDKRALIGSRTMQLQKKQRARGARANRKAGRL